MPTPDMSFGGASSHGRGHALALGILLVLIGVCVTVALRGHEPRIVGDVNWYLHFMRVVAADGAGSFPRLFADWLADPGAWISPSPLRVGFILTSAGFARVFGSGPEALLALSVASFCACVVVNWAFASRRMAPLPAFLLGALLLFSPLWLGLARHLLADSFTTLCLSVSVWTFLHLVETPASRRAWVVFVLAFAWTILVKEVTVLLAAPLGLFVMVERFVRRTPLPLVRLGLALVLPPVVAVAVMALAAGGVGPMLEMVRIVLTSPATNVYAQKFCSGPWYRYLIDFLCFSPWVTVLAFLGAGGVVARWRAGEYPRGHVYFGMLFAVLLLEHSFLVKNVRYVTLLEVPLRSFALFFVFDVLGRTKRAGVLVTLVVVVLCALDWMTFQRLWVDGNLYDPTTPRLLGLRDMLPWKW